MDGNKKKENKMTSKRNSRTVGVLAILLPVMLGVVGVADEPETAVEVTLASEQQVLLPIVIGVDASESVREAAALLVEYLGRISGAEFEVVDGERHYRGGDTK